MFWLSFNAFDDEGDYPEPENDDKHGEKYDAEEELEKGCLLDGGFEKGKNAGYEDKLGHVVKGAGACYDGSEFCSQLVEFFQDVE